METVSGLINKQFQMLGCSPMFWHRSRLACGELITHLVVDCIHGHWAHTYPSLNTLLNHDRSLKAHFPDWILLRVCQWHLYQIKRHFLPGDPHTCRQQQRLCVLQKGIKLTIRGYGSCYMRWGLKDTGFGILLTLAGSKVFLIPHFWKHHFPSFATLTL